MKLELRDQEVALLQFRPKVDYPHHGSVINHDIGRYVVLGENVDPEFEQLLTHSNAVVCTMEALNLSEDNDKFWLLFSQDCAFPPMYLVRACNEQDAVEEFLDKTDICTISEEDMKDYLDESGNEKEEVHMSDNGKRCDISQLQAIELELLVVITKEGISAIAGALGWNNLPKVLSSKAKVPMQGNRMLDIT